LPFGAGEQFVKRQGKAGQHVGGKRAGIGNLDAFAPRSVCVGRPRARVDAPNRADADRAIVAQLAEHLEGLRAWQIPPRNTALIVEDVAAKVEMR